MAIPRSKNFIRPIMPHSPPAMSNVISVPLCTGIRHVITTPEKNQVVLSFYNNDVSGAFRVILEGMTRDGKLAHIEQIME